jgi:DNA-binding IclR family transcriptional regulator
MTSLAASVDEAVLLTRRSGSQVVCVERVESTHPIRLSYERGQVLPVHAGASAKVLLAFSEPHEIDEALDGARLPKLTPETITDKRDLRRQLREIRARGYAISDGEADVGVRGVAAPIIDTSGRVAAGLSVAGPAFRLGDDRLSEVISEVTTAARTIGERLSRLSG